MTALHQHTIALAFMIFLLAIAAPAAQGSEAQLSPGGKAVVEDAGQAARLELAKVELEQAKARYARLSDLANRGQVSIEEVENAKVAVARAEIQLRLVQADPAQEKQLRVALAKVELEHAAARHARVKKLFEQGVVTAEEYEAAQGDQLRAEVRLRRTAADTDTARAEAEVALAQVELQLARARLERIQKLFAAGAATQDALEDAKAQAQRAEIQLRAAAKAAEAVSKPQGKSGAAAPMAPVSVRIVTGQRADDPDVNAADGWIVGMLKDQGIPRTQATSEWVELADQEKEIYASMMGGRLIKGQCYPVGEQMAVRLTGHAIGKTPRIVLISNRPGEGTVTQLTDYPAPGNVYIAVRIGPGPEAPRPQRRSDGRE